MKSVKAFLTLNLCGPVELLIVHSYATQLVGLSSRLRTSKLR